MNKTTLSVALAMLGLAVGPVAHAAISVSGSVGGAPTGVFKVNFDDLALGSAGGVATGPNGSVTVAFTDDGGVVTGEDAALYAAPVLSGGNGLGFGPGNTDQANGDDTTPYLITGLGSVTLTFSESQTYLGLLWGSVDSFNTLEFYSGATLVGTVTGSDVLASPNGDQGVLGTLYVNITSTIPFDRIVATSTGRTFEFDNVAFNPTIPGCSGCVRTQGYWKNHASAWPVTSVTLGMLTYTQEQLLQIFGQPVKGNGLVSLAHQLIAAKLNIATGACFPTDVTNAVAAADLLIGSLVVPPVGSGKLATADTSQLTAILNEYNNGLSPGGPGHCD
jgi:hypothetical protein